MPPSTTTSGPVMSAETGIPLRCRCGKVRGGASGISPAAGFRLLCYCGDCQAFARFLGQPDVLDAAGGTDIFQMPPRRMTLTAGQDAVRCLRLSERGIHRWYAGCCRTPIANTAGPRIPLLGLIHAFIAEGAPRDMLLGPPLCRIFSDGAVGPLPLTAPPPPSYGLLLRRASRLLGWWARGLASPHPLFEAGTKAPRVVPRVLTPGERSDLG